MFIALETFYVWGWDETSSAKGKPVQQSLLIYVTGLQGKKAVLSAVPMPPMWSSW
jgi:hypothetical protein